MIIKSILSFLVLLLIVMGIPSAVRLAREAGMNLKRLTYVVGCYKLYTVEGWKSRNVLLSFAGCAIMDLLVVFFLWSLL